MAAQGRELRAFVAMMRYPGLVAVAATKGIGRIEDLKGKTVGVSALGSSTHMFLNYLLATHGLKAADVSTAAIGMAATAVGAMTHGKVDAAIMTDPSLAIVLKQRPMTRLLADTRTAEGVRVIFGADQYPSAVLYSTAPWLERHSQEARRLARALTRTLDWMRTHPPEQIRARMPERFRTEDVEADLESLRTYQAMLSPDGKLTPESVEIVRKVLSLTLDNVRTANIDLGKTYTNEFIDR
jgi:NitT/TauT family transport system substrate-binding protein